MRLSQDLQEPPARTMQKEDVAGGRCGAIDAEERRPVSQFGKFPMDAGAYLLGRLRLVP
jgi:hypothetical protein